ncbi:MAG TPA: hypothetical protein PKY77_24490 [Phycisphaerae bacterium]|nr:hypothetical protein [Phycisphaerae bacterium]HRY70689.1 hypothetical protein [Phycisphaerae bacterium]HSA28716.1 hypothetical protein [Phycisphaerae bacterium]
MPVAYPDPLFPIGQFFESLLPDFILAFTFFTALTYAVLGKRFDHQRSAVAMAAAVGLALAAGLVAWEYQRGWSIRNLGPIAIGFAVILLAMIMFQGIRQTGGSWAGAGIAFGASILVAWILGVDWPIAPQVIQSLAIVALIVGIVAFVQHHHGALPRAQFVPAAIRPELRGIRHDMSDLYADRRVGDQIGEALAGLRQRTASLVEHPQEAPHFMAQLERILPAAGWLTERLAKLRAQAHDVRKGHVARIDQLRHLIDKLPPESRRKAERELAARYAELHMDKRLDRLDAAVAENERRIGDLTREAQAAVGRHDYRKLAELLEAADKLQVHNSKLLAIIERSEQKLARVARDLAKQMGEAAEE